MPMVGFLPPAPTPEIMRSGTLGTYGQDPRIMAAIPSRDNAAMTTENNDKKVNED